MVHVRPCGSPCRVHRACAECTRPCSACPPAALDGWGGRLTGRRTWKFALVGADPQLPAKPAARLSCPPVHRQPTNAPLRRPPVRSDVFANSPKPVAIRNNWEFMVQRCGGPPMYSQRKGGRGGWLACMLLLLLLAQQWEALGAVGRCRLLSHTCCCLLLRTPCKHPTVWLSASCLPCTATMQATPRCRGDTRPLSAPSARPTDTCEGCAAAAWPGAAAAAAAAASDADAYAALGLMLVDCMRAHVGLLLPLCTQHRGLRGWQLLRRLASILPMLMRVALPTTPCPCRHHMDAALAAVPELSDSDRRKLHNCAWLG